jgi:hypothetical protein
MTTLTLNPQTHTYFADGIPIRLSVTQLLEMVGIVPPYPEDAKANVEAAGKLGTGVHSACELIDCGLENSSTIEKAIDPKLVPYVAGYGQFLVDMKPSWEYIEQPFSKEGIAGTPDRIGHITTKTGAVVPVIVDLKTAKRIAAHWGIQLSAYQWLSEWDGLLYVLWLKANGKYELINFPFAEVWHSAVEVAKWIVAGDGAVSNNKRKK